MNKGESNEKESMKNGIRINKHWKDKAKVVKKRSTILQYNTLYTVGCINFVKQPHNTVEYVYREVFQIRNFAKTFLC